MKRLLSFIICLAWFNHAAAQIVLTQSSYPSYLIGTDTLRKTIHFSPFPTMGPISGEVRDLSTTVDTLPLFFKYRVTTTTTPYNFADSNLDEISTFSYVRNEVAAINSSSIGYFGYLIPFRSYNISALTSNPYDSLIIPSQTSTYTTPHTKILFPATYGSSWSSAYSCSTLFELSVAAYSLLHAPITKKQIIFESNHVIGWGQLRVKDALGNPSDYFDVLQIQTVTETVDSFFLSGSPMPGSLLGILSLDQGKKDSVFAHNYYRAGEVTPLAQILFTNSSFSQPYLGTMHQQRLVKVGVHEFVNDEIQLYPNPIHQGSLFISGCPPGNYHVQVSGINGAIVHSGAISIGAQPYQLRLSHLPRGAYIITLQSSDHTYTRQFVLQ